MSNISTLPVLTKSDNQEFLDWLKKYLEGKTVHGTDAYSIRINVLDLVEHNWKVKFFQENPGKSLELDLPLVVDAVMAHLGY